MQVAGIVEFFVEFDEERDLWEVFIAPSQGTLDQAVAESKCCRRETVGNGWVDGVVVSVIVIFWQKFKLENVQNPRSQNNRQPLVISDVLQKRTYNFARLIKQP